MRQADRQREGNAMAETRQQLKTRLQGAGLWDDYVTMRGQHENEGMTPKQARDEALRRLDSRLSPVSKPPAAGRPSNGYSTSAPDVVDTSGLDFGRQVPNHDAVQWVAQNLANGN